MSHVAVTHEYLPVPPPLAQSLEPCPQLGTQLPIEHFATPLFEVITLHDFPQVPQFLGSVPVLTH